MLKPTKYTHLDKNLINFASKVLKEMKLRKHMSYNSIFSIFEKANIEVLFLPTLTFLYALNLISYNKFNDSFIYEGQ